MKIISLQYIVKTLNSFMYRKKQGWLYFLNKELWRIIMFSPEYFKIQTWIEMFFVIHMNEYSRLYG